MGRPTCTGGGSLKGRLHTCPLFLFLFYFYSFFFFNWLAGMLPGCSSRPPTRTTPLSILVLVGFRDSAQLWRQTFLGVVDNVEAQVQPVANLFVLMLLLFRFFFLFTFQLRSALTFWLTNFRFPGRFLFCPMDNGAAATCTALSGSPKGHLF